MVLMLGSSRTRAFLPAVTQHCFRQHSPTCIAVLYDPQSTDDEFVDFPTSSQRVTLKKEASKRLARNEMATFSLSPDESDGVMSVTKLQELWSTLSDNEMILVRGISKDDKKLVYRTAQRICASLETIQSDLAVTLLSTKGHTAILYCPSLPLDHPLHIPLRTSVGQKNKWRARTKPARDNRGQVIRE